MNHQESTFYCESIEQLKKIIPNHGLTLTQTGNKTEIKKKSILVIENNPNLLDVVRFFEVETVNYNDGILKAREMHQLKQVLKNEFSKNTGVCIPLTKKYITDDLTEFNFENNDIYLNNIKIGKLLKNERIYITNGVSFSYFNAICFTTIF